MDIKRLWNCCLRMVPSLSSDIFLVDCTMYLWEMVIYSYYGLLRYLNVSRSLVLQLLLRYMGLRANLLF